MSITHNKSIERMHLEIMRAIHETGSLTAAARRLSLTQSALSHSMKKLERISGAVLWERDGRNIVYTQAGHDLLAAAQRILPQIESAEGRLFEFAEGSRGTLRIGMECHPCYQWLLGIVGPYLDAFPHVDVDVKQKFQFGGIEALYSHDIDLLVTPDPLKKKGLVFHPVLDFEQRIVMSDSHPLAQKTYIVPCDLASETLITYPVSADRLDIFSQFLTPAGILPRHHKVIETTDILLQMIASGRGIGALPHWLINEYAGRMALTSVRAGPSGIQKQIFLGIRKTDCDISYVQAFLDCALAHEASLVVSSLASPTATQ